MREDFSVTKDSIRLPYRRFLSDSAAGVGLLLLLVVSYYVPLFTTTSMREQVANLAGHAVVVGDEVKVFCLIGAFLLATPLGFVVNAMSWLILGQVIVLVEEWCFSSARSAGGGPFFPVSDIAASRETVRLAHSFGLTQENGTHVTSLLRRALDTPNLTEYAPEKQVRGLMILLRNIALFLFCGAQITLRSSDQRLGFQFAFWIVTVGFLFLLTRRSRTPFVVVTQVVVVGGFAALFLSGSHAMLIARAASLFVVATVVVFIAGVVGYYDCCGVILHAYFGVASLGGHISESPSETTVDPLQVITAMLGAASDVAR